MKSAVLVMGRRIEFRKEIWRTPNTRRTLSAIDVTDLIAGNWKTHRTEVGPRGYIELSLSADGKATENPPSFHPLEEQQARFFAGLFEFVYLSWFEVRLTLREEQCATVLPKPYRPNRALGTMAPWKPVRVLLNGRFADHDDSVYVLQEYYVALCCDPAPIEIEPVRLIDLQADLY